MRITVFYETIKGDRRMKNKSLMKFIKEKKPKISFLVVYHLSGLVCNLKTTLS